MPGKDGAPGLQGLPGNRGHTGLPGLQGLSGHSVTEAEIRDICANVLRGYSICVCIIVLGFVLCCFFDNFARSIYLVYQTEYFPDIL